MDREHLLVVGGSGEVGREVARLGVALGHDVTSICLTGVAPTDEPWTAGVTWIQGDITKSGDWESTLEEVLSVAVCCAAPTQFFQTVYSGRVVHVFRGEPGFAINSLDADVVVMFHALKRNDELSDSEEIRVEQLGMATLRCMLEEERKGVLNHDEVVHLGDAMMIQ